MRIIKCVAVGDNAAGKTELIKTYVTNKFLSTSVYDNCAVTMMIGNEQYILGLSDTAGQEDYDRLRLLTYPQTDVFLICFSVILPISFRNVEEKWYPEIQRYCPGVPCLIVGTHTELRNDPQTVEKLSRQHMRPITSEQGETLVRKFGAVKYLECSTLTQKGLKNVFDEAVIATLNIKQPRSFANKIKSFYKRSNSNVKYSTCKPNR